MKNQKPRYGTIGSISHATMRTEDLIPEFLWTANRLKLSSEDLAIVRRIGKSADVDSEELRDVYFSSEESDEDLNELFDLLDRYAPPFFYFGASEGDGSDYGFWLSQESLDNDVASGEVWIDQDCDCRLSMVVSVPCMRGLTCPSSHMKLDGITLEWNDMRRKGLCLMSCASRMPKTANYRLVVSDHGNQTLYDRKGREVWGIV